MDSARDQLASYLRSVRTLGLSRVAKVLALVAVGTFAEAIGILLLIPLLGIIFASFAGPGLGSTVSGWLQGILPDMSRDAQLAVILGIFLLLICIRALVAWRRDIESMQLSQDIVELWRNRILTAVASASWRKLQEMQNSRLEFAAATEVGRLSSGSDLLLRGLVGAVQLVLLLMVAFYLSPALTLLVLACVLVMSPILLPLIRRAHRHGEALSERGSRRQNVFSEMLAGMKLAKVHDAEQRFAREFISVSDDLRVRVTAFANMQYRLGNAFQVAGGAAAAAIAYIGLAWMHVSPAVLTSLLVLLTRIIGPVQQLTQSVQSMLTMLPAIGHLDEIDNALKGDPVSETSQPRSGVALPSIAGPVAIAVQHADYTPPGRGETLLRIIDMTIGAGELAVLLGPSGSGKTTIADMLLGLIAPENGQIDIGGYAMGDQSQRDVMRKHIAYVPQDPFLFDRTIRQNLLWAEPEASEEQMLSALQQAEASEFVANLASGLDTPVGNRGSRLSGGERQRICLARALLRNPSLLILDEATSALDAVVEEKLLRTMMKLRGQMTLLVIAHRLPDWFAPDRWFMVEDGMLKMQPHRKHNG